MNGSAVMWCVLSNVLSEVETNVLKQLRMNVMWLIQVRQLLLWENLKQLCYFVSLQLMAVDGAAAVVAADDGDDGVVFGRSSDDVSVRGGECLLLLL